MRSKTHAKTALQFFREYLSTFDVIQESSVVLENKLVLSDIIKARGSRATFRRNSERKEGKRIGKIRFRHLRSVCNFASVIGVR